MNASTFTRRIGLGFAGTVFLAIVITVVSVYALRSVIRTNDLNAFNHAHDLFDVEKLRTKAQQRIAIGRGFLLTRNGLFMEDARLAHQEMREIIDRLALNASGAEDRRTLERVRAAERGYEASLQRAFRMARGKKPDQRKLARFFNADTMPKFDAWERTLAAYVKIKVGQLENARSEARSAGTRALRLIFVIAAGGLMLAVMLGFVLTRTLTRLYNEVGIAVRAREDVLAIVSHDLRNPLTSVMLSSAMMLKNPDLPPDARAKLTRTLHTSAQEMKKLIEDLLDFVRAEFGHMTVTKRAEPPETLLIDVQNIFVPRMKEKSIQFHQAIDPSVISIECEKNRVIQILSNLLGNAIKFTPVGGTIQLNVNTVGHETLFCVRDSGPGIPPHLLGHVFDRDWQAQKARSEGVGLGLAIAKGLVEAHGGRIWVESMPGEGALFFFTLPLSGFVEGLKTAVLKFPIRDQAGKSQSPKSPTQ